MEPMEHKDHWRDVLLVLFVCYICDIWVSLLKYVSLQGAVDVAFLCIQCAKYVMVARGLCVGVAIHVMDKVHVNCSIKW